MAISKLEYDKLVTDFMVLHGPPIMEHFQKGIDSEYKKLLSQGLKGDDLTLALIQYASFQSIFKIIALVFAHVYDLDIDKEPDMKNILKLVEKNLTERSLDGGSF